MAGSSRAGFTLVEVTLSIVIGIILIAGATLLYQQAKLGAGNTRAKAKVTALQGVVEEILANGSGSAPSSAAVYGAWATRRPDDLGQSPWGGPAGTPIWGNVNKPGFAGADAVSRTLWGQAPPDPANVGVSGYIQFSGTATCSIYDVTVGSGVTVRTYETEALGPDGSGYWFVMGGK